jgi:serine/threonine protein kinase
MINRGAVLGGRYAVDRVLGQGGMGVVVAARHIELRQRVAIKMLLASEHQDAELLRRFERESRSVAELSSEHVARVTDIGTFEDGSPFMVMEYLEGEDLQARIDREGPLPIALAVRLFAQAAIGLGDAHEHHVIHRDVKPSNLFLTRRRSGRLVLKVLDFGIAKADDEPLEASMTSISSLIGSPQYMSPEQLCDPRAVDPRTDVWSLGASFYEAISGCAAFPADSLPELHMKVLAFEPPRLSSLRPDCPPELDLIVQRCLAKDAAQRFASMSELQHALEELESSALSDAIPPDSSPLVTASNVPVVNLPTGARGAPFLSLPPPAARVASVLPAPPLALGRSRTLGSPRTLGGAGDPPSESGTMGASMGLGATPVASIAPISQVSTVAQGGTNAEEPSHDERPSAARLALTASLVAAVVSSLVASVTTFALTRSHAFEGREPIVAAPAAAAVAVATAPSGPSAPQPSSPVEPAPPAAIAEHAAPIDSVPEAARAAAASESPAHATPSATDPSAGKKRATRAAPTKSPRHTHTAAPSEGH